MRETFWITVAKLVGTFVAGVAIFLVLGAIAGLSLGTYLRWRDKKLVGGPKELTIKQQNTFRVVRFILFVFVALTPFLLSFEMAPFDSFLGIVGFGIINMEVCKVYPQVEYKDKGGWEPKI